MEVNFFIEGGHVLTQGNFRHCSFAVVDGKFDFRSDVNRKCTTISAKNRDVLPGIIDLHGDAFEHVLMPRSSVSMPVRTALLEVDKQLLANGITTAYHGVTLSYEPGLRSFEQAKIFLDELQFCRQYLSARHQLHLRVETFAFAYFHEIPELISGFSDPILAFNDHLTPVINDDAVIKRKLKKMASRSGMTEEAYLAMIKDLWAKNKDIDDHIQILAKSCGSKAVFFSHDEYDVQQRRKFRALGCHVSEFPMAEDVAHDAQNHFEFVVMGAPNALRGLSHNGAISARDMIKKGLCNILSSDYYYPSLLGSMYLLADQQILSLSEAWKLVSANPADALKLTNQGRIEDGNDADFILVARTELGPVVTDVFCRGRHAYHIDLPS